MNRLSLTCGRCPAQEIVSRHGQYNPFNYIACSWLEIKSEVMVNRAPAGSIRLYIGISVPIV